MKEVIELTPICKCGQAILLPEGKTRARCPVDGCGMRWERGPEGYWATGLFTIIFTPIFTEQPKRKLNHYQKYMRWRDKGKGKKGSIMTYERFFKRLETCGGCTGQRDKTKCQFAIVYAYVEKLYRKGVIKSSKDFCYPINGSDPMSFTNESYLPGDAAISQTTSASIGSHKAD